jgi:hypothetical protein
LYHHEQCFGCRMLSAQQEYLWVLMLLQLNSIHNLIILRTRYFPLLQNVQAGCGAHPASCSVGTEFFRGVKRPGRDIDHSPPTSAEIKNGCSTPCTPLYVFMSCTGTLILILLTWKIRWANNTSKWQMGFNSVFNPLNAELNPICHLLALLRAHLIFCVSRMRVKGLITYLLFYYYYYFKYKTFLRVVYQNVYGCNQVSFAFWNPGCKIMYIL